MLTIRAASTPQSEKTREEPAIGGAVTSSHAVRWETGNLLPVVVLAAGFVVRLVPAWRFFLNPDEALHYLLSGQSSVSLAYKAALTNSHPPLLILVLYYWRAFGHSEVMLRLPSVLAGTACCWLIYQWLELVSDRSTALVGLLLASFAPAMIDLSWEIRQYALLMLFVAGCLHLSERALRENSLPLMIGFSLSLYGALLVHYSSLLFAFMIGVYMLLRLYPYGKRRDLFAVWAAGQILGVAIGAYYFVTHVRSARLTGMVHGDFETYLRKSIFHAGEDNPASFVATQTLRVFTYLFSHGVVGALALLAFLAGMIWLLRGKTSLNKDGPTPRQFALLLGLAFLVTCVAAFAKQYPYGGSRHAAILLVFAVAGVSIGLARIPGQVWVKLLVIAAALAVCNVFPAPPPVIRPRNQNRALMKNAVAYLRQSAPPGSTVLTDYQSGLLLGYYACGHGIVEEFPPLEPFFKAGCGPYSVMSSRPDVWKFHANDLPSRLAAMAAAYGLAPGTKVWLFDAGWISDSAPAIVRDPQAGCSAPRSFGENILVCQLTVGAEKVQARNQSPVEP
jgi:hypothetical protein